VKIGNKKENKCIFSSSLGGAFPNYVGNKMGLAFTKMILSVLFIER